MNKMKIKNNGSYLSLFIEMIMRYWAISGNDRAFLSFDELGLKIYEDTQTFPSLGLWFYQRIGRIKFADHRA